MEENNNSYGQPEQSGNQNFGQPEQQYGNESYGQTEQQYGNQGYGQTEQQYGNQSYGQQYGEQSFGRNYGMGAVPLGEDGQPLKNRFGMKMTFSILEILSCCSCNIVTMVLGIVGCIFTTKANNAYKQGDAQEYKTNAKTASICLWIGLGVGLVYLIMGIFAWTVGGYGKVFMDAFWEGYNSVDSSYEQDHNNGNTGSGSDAPVVGSDEDGTGTQKISEDTESKDDASVPAPSANVVPGEGFTDASITVNGVTVTLPLSYTELKELGFSTDETSENTTVETSEYYYVDLLDTSGAELGSVYVGNLTESSIALKDGVVFGFWFTSDDLENDKLEVSFNNGLTDHAVKEDFMTAFGEPDYSYESEDSDYQSYQWYNHNEMYSDTSENSFTVKFWEGKLDEIDIRYIGWE